MLTPSIQRVAVVTGTRADYRLLRNTLLRLHADPAIDLHLLVTGTHLLESFGNTETDIETDELPIAARFHIIDENIAEPRQQIAQAMATMLTQLTAYFSKHPVDLVLLLGDRYETFAAAQAAVLNNIPIAHIHGGEITEGAIDEVMRHSITKMANLHFVATDHYRQRVIQLGEPPESVFTVGAPGLEGIDQQSYLDKAQLEAALGFSLPSPAILITYHPETSMLPDSAGFRGGKESLAKQIDEQINALLQALTELPDVFCLFTAPNADAGGAHALQRIKTFVSEQANRARYVASLGEQYYLSTVRAVDAVVGNSSSGIIEVPAFGVPTVNIGDRQAGRDRADSVIDVPCEHAAIKAGIRQALQCERQKPIHHPYLLNDVQTSPSELMHAIIKRSQFPQGARKKFYDLPSHLAVEVAS